MLSLHLPIDELSGGEVNASLAADYVELVTFFSRDGSINLSSEITGIIDISGEDDTTDTDTQNDEYEAIIEPVTRHIGERQEILGNSSYPFALDEDGNILTCLATESMSKAHAAYILSLVLSHLKSGLITNTDIMSKEEVRKMREYFQYFATAALAAEIRGDAWSFGFPRTDGTSFLKKLRLIWEEFNDGRVEPQVGAPESPKDDQIDVFAARLHPDKLPGFLLATAQVATGMDFKGKSLKGHVTAFKQRWFTKEPLTDFIPYMIIPFMRSDSQFIDDVRVCGNVLHRLRVPRLVAEAGMMDDDGGKMDDRIENYEELERAVAWLVKFRARCLAA